MPQRQLDNAEIETNYGFVSGSGNARAVAFGLPGHTRYSALPGSLASGSERGIGDPKIHTRAGSMKPAQQRSEV